MTQQKLDGFFSSTPSSTRSSKRSRVTQITPTDRDEFDDLFETTSSAKRRRTNNNSTKQVTDVFAFEMPSTSTSTIKKTDNEKLTSSLKKKRSVVIDDDDDENKAIDELLNNDTRKKFRRPIKQEESSDLLDMFKTRTNTNIPQTITTMDDFKTPICPKPSTTQKKIQMFFDDSDLILLREQANEQNDVKDYIYVKPVLVTSGQWLSKEAETKITCDTMQTFDVPTTDNNIPDDQRNLMHIQYAPLIVDDQTNGSNKKSKGSKRTSQSSKSSSSSTNKILDGKSFHKQLVLSDSTIVRKDNLRSCYNALLEDLNKPHISSINSKKSSVSKSSRRTDEIMISDDDEQTTNIDFFDFSTRKKKF